MFTPVTAYLNMLFVDHGIFRLAYLNLHRLGDRAWRCSQPAPHHVRTLARRGIRTIINLRGERHCGSYWLEQKACEQYNVVLVNFPIRSRRAPTREELKAAIELLDRIEYPMLMHCKSGADRTGLMSVLYLILQKSVPLAKARRQLSPRYGYFRHTSAGILYLFFEQYLEDSRRHPMPFAEWVENVYDPEKLTRAFRAKTWANRLAVLKSE
jgi:protein tyrosine/serine phosphatase